MIRLRVFFVALLLACCVGASAAAAPAQTPLMLRTGDTRLNLAKNITWFKDASGTLSIDAVHQREDFVPLKSDLSAGFTAAAVWLRFDLQGNDQAASTWILEVANALLDDVRLYEPLADGSYREHRSGEDLPRADWEVDYRTPAFYLTLDNTVAKRYYLRLWTRNAMSSSVRLWYPEAFAATTRGEAFIDGLFYGVFVLILVFHFFFWLWTREKLGGWYVPYVAANFVAAAMTAGYIQKLAGLPGYASDLILGATICLQLGISNTFSLVQLELKSVMPRFTRLFLPCMWLLGIGTALLVLTGNYGAGVGTAQMAILVCIVLLISIASYLAWRGHRPARFYLLAFGIFYAAVAMRFLRNLGVLPPSFFTEYGIPITSMLHMVIMSLGITGHYNQIKREKMEAQAALNESLEKEVMERTAALVDEIARREASEQEVRRALAVEVQASEEQQEFVAMVSHEFRTPLAIIDTVTQRLADNLDAPHDKSLQRCTNIREATKRMSDMMDEYLSFDRLGGELTLSRSSGDPTQLLRMVAAEWEPSRLRLECAGLPATFACDFSLLRIALRNLIANAMRHSPPDARVTLSASGLPGGGIGIVVADEGEGIPDDEIPKLFVKYFRGRAAQMHPGAGLGLYLVDRIAKLHGGSARVETGTASGGKGSRFVLTLPES